jgi:hypothetical protein
MVWMSLTMSPIFCAVTASVFISPLVACASSTAMRTTVLVCVICRAISAMELDSSSSAPAAVRTPVEASCEAATALSAHCEVWLEAAESVTAVDFIAAALSPNVLSSVSILVRNAAIAVSMAPRRRCWSEA